MSDNNKIVVEFNIPDWVWLCEFLSQVIHEGELDEYTKEDTEHLYDVLTSAERGKGRINK